MSAAGSVASSSSPESAKPGSPRAAVLAVDAAIRRYWNSGLHAPAPPGGVASLAEARTRRLRLELCTRLQDLGVPEPATLAQTLVIAAQGIALEEWRRGSALDADREALLYCLRQELLEAPCQGQLTR